MKQEVIKHSAAVQISNTITLLQRQTWNVLLANAYDELAGPEEHSIPAEVLMDQLQITTRNTRHLKDALKALMSTVVEWNVMGRDQAEDWEATTLLASARLRAGLCTYSYSPSLRRRLHNPRIYAKVKLAIQCKFGSKHALAIYELACDFRNVSQTPWMEVDELKKLTDTTGRGYSDFNKWRTRVLDVAVDEINKRSDLVIEPSYDKGEKGRVERIKFGIKPRMAGSTDQMVSKPTEDVQDALVVEEHPRNVIDVEAEMRHLTDGEREQLRQHAIERIKDVETYEPFALETLIRLKMKALLVEAKMPSSTNASQSELF